MCFIAILLYARAHKFLDLVKDIRLRVYARGYVRDTPANLLKIAKNHKHAKASLRRDQRDIHKHT